MVRNFGEFGGSSKGDSEFSSFPEEDNFMGNWELYSYSIMNYFWLHTTYSYNVYCVSTVHLSFAKGIKYIVEFWKIIFPNWFGNT